MSDERITVTATEAGKIWRGESDDFTSSAIQFERAADSRIYYTAIVISHRDQTLWGMPWSLCCMTGDDTESEGNGVELFYLRDEKQCT